MIYVRHFSANNNNAIAAMMSELCKGWFINYHYIIIIIIIPVDQCLLAILMGSHTTKVHPFYT